MHLFYSPDFTLAEHSFETTRKAAWVAEAITEYQLTGLVMTEPPSLSCEELSAVHAPAYVEAVKTGNPRELAQSQGFNWDKQLYRSVCASNGGVVAAAVQALKDGVAGSLSSGLHHARENRGAGFCTFNGLVLAARRALECGAENVLLLDFDAHCGGGTYSLICRDERVTHLDVAVADYDRYPLRREFDSLELVRQKEHYLNTIAEALAKAAERNFSLCIYNAGMDPFEGCPVGGKAGINASILEVRERLVFEWCRAHTIPVAFVLAGGYVGPQLSRKELVDLHLLTVCSAQRAWRGEKQ